MVENMKDVDENEVRDLFWGKNIFDKMV